jgi:hypothetical protein
VHRCTWQPTCTGCNSDTLLAAYAPASEEHDAYADYNTSCVWAVALISHESAKSTSNCIVLSLAVGLAGVWPQSVYICLQFRMPDHQLVHGLVEPYTGIELWLDSAMSGVGGS